MQVFPFGPFFEHSGNFLLDTTKIILEHTTSALWKSLVPSPLAKYSTPHLPVSACRAEEASSWSKPCSLHFSRLSMSLHRERKGKFPWERRNFRALRAHVHTHNWHRYAICFSVKYHPMWFLQTGYHMVALYWLQTPFFGAPLFGAGAPYMIIPG